MSTRSQIVFKRTHSWEEDGETVEKTEKITTYKHHDGYPRVTVPQLRKYHDFANSRANDIEYYVATWFYWYKRKRERRNRENGYKGLEPLEDKTEMDDDFEVPQVLTGVGICADDHIHGDVHNLYMVDLNRGEIWHYTHGVDAHDSVDDLIDAHDPKRVYHLDAEPDAGFNK